MSSATRPSGSLSSVWDTLNAIKARQRAEVAPAKALAARRASSEPGAARKQLLQLFERRVAAAADAHNLAQHTSSSSSTTSTSPTASASTSSKTNARELLNLFQQDCMDDPHVSKLREQYVTRAQNDPSTQLAAVRRLLREAEDGVIVAKHALRGAQRVSKGLVGVVGG